MARASAWGTGQALAYRSMGADEQADLFCLYHASRTTDGEELTQAVRAGLSLAVADVARAYAEHQGEHRENRAQPAPHPNSRPTPARPTHSTHPQTDRAAAPAASRAGGRRTPQRDRGREYADPPSDPARIFG